MADDFNTSQNTSSRTSEDFNTQVETNKLNTGGNLQRPTYNSFWKRQSSNDLNNQIYSPGEQQSPTVLNKKFSFINKVTKSFTKSTDSFDYYNQNSFSSSNDMNRSPQRLTSESEQSQVHINEPAKKAYYEGRENSFEAWNQTQSESYHGEDYGTEDASAYYQEEYANDQKPYKKKGLSFKIDRLVQRVPALGIFYKQPPSSPDKSEFDQKFKYNQSSASVDSNQLTRELTADELALNQRYSDKTCMKFINLPANDQTQPVDLRIHHETNKIYLCDVTRSIVEIYNINGTLEHMIDNSTMLKFQPTAIAVAFDGTIIIASHFNHCLHMYTPNDSKTEANLYSYKQFKLGTLGNQMHQFYQPAGIAIDPNDGYVYVCDRGNYRLQVITPEGLCQRVIELFLNHKKKHQLDPIRVAFQQNFDQIVCIIGDGDTICFIPKHANGKTYVDPLYIFDEHGLGLEGASGLAIDSNDRIFISDTGHNRIVICTPEGSYITSFGSAGDGLGQLKRPCGLDITNNGTVVVTDPGNKRIQLFGLIHEQTPVENNPPEENSTDTELEFVNL